MATQNPIEQEGTYPLPEAQLDRFMFNVLVNYPSEQEEFNIVRLTTAPRTIDLQHVLSAEDVMQLQELVRKVPVADHVIRYALEAECAKPAWVRPIRPSSSPKTMRELGLPDPRASQVLVPRLARPRALLQGRYQRFDTGDIRAIAYPALRHRVLTNFNAEAEGIKPDDIIRMLIENTPYDAEGEKTAASLPKVFATRS